MSDDIAPLPGATPSGSSRARGWIAGLGFALLISLGLNLFLGGIMLGRDMRGGALGLTEGNLRVGIERVLRVLPDDDRRIFRARFDGQRDAIRTRFIAFREARRAVGEQLRTEPLDRVAFDAAYAAMRTRNTELQDSIHSIVQAAIPELSPEGRQAIAEARWR